MHPQAAHIQLIQTATKHTLKTVVVRQDAIGRVISGEKRLHTEQGERHVFKKNQHFILNRGAQLDIVNQPEPLGLYRAEILNFSANLIDIFNQHYPQFLASALQTGRYSAVTAPHLTECFTRTLSAFEGATKVSDRLQQHRALELLLLLAEQGVVFLGSAHLTWSERIHHLLSHAPLRDWDLSSVAAKLFLSKSTLQRKLAAEATSFSQCLLQVRLDRALALLQSSQQAVAIVAAQCGYESHSRFSAAFKKRFGLLPSQIRQSD